MGKRHLGLKVAASIAVGLGVCGIAPAQEFKLPVSMSYSSTDKSTWNTVLIVSGVVLAVGLLQSENTLALLGAAGVVVSLVELNNNHFRNQYFPHGVDLMHSGPVAFGFTPFGHMGLTDEKIVRTHPTVYLSASFKF